MRALLILWLCLAPLSIQAVEKVSIEDADGRTFTNATLREWTADQIVVEEKSPQSISMDDVLTMTFGRQPTPLSGGDPLIILSNGDRLVLRPISISDDELTAAWHKFHSRPNLKLPLEMVTAIIFDLPTATDDRQRLSAALQTLPAGEDIVLLVNGDRVQGELERLDGAFVELKGAAGQLKLDRSRVQAVRLNPELTAAVRMPGRRQMLTLRDGSRMTARLIEMIDGDVKCQTFTMQEFVVAASDCVACKVYGTRAIPLSEREPSQVTFVPYLSHSWPLVKNANVLRGPLSLRGIEYGIGLGVHSRSLVTYDVQAGDREFRSTIGVDDAAAGAGNVQFRVEVDGRNVWNSPELTGRSAAMAVPPVALAGAKKLTLVVDFGMNADILDYANWCDAIVVRE